MSGMFVWMEMCGQNDSTVDVCRMGGRRRSDKVR